MGRIKSKSKITVSIYTVITKVHGLRSKMTSKNHSMLFETDFYPLNSKMYCSKKSLSKFKYPVVFSEPVSYKEQTIINCLISELLSRRDGADLQLNHVVMKSKQCYNRTGSSKASVMVLEVVVLSEKYLDWCHSLQLIIFCVSNPSPLILDDHCFRNNSTRIQNLQNFRNIAHQYFIILKKLLIGCGGWLEFTG